MSTLLRPADPSECDALSALCLRSKGHWGYTADFLAACREELTLRPADIGHLLRVAEGDGRLAGVARIAPEDGAAELMLLYVDLPFIGRGIGRMLFDWAATEARNMGARRLLIDADPGAAPFYRHMGARRIGTSPSGSIPGRSLPRLALDLR